MRELFSVIAFPPKHLVYHLGQRDLLFMIDNLLFVRVPECFYSTQMTQVKQICADNIFLERR